MINIVIADDHQVVIDGLKALLRNETDIAILGEALRGDTLLDLLSKSGSSVTLVLLDINMPGIDGIEAAKKIKAAYPKIKLLVLSMYNKPYFIKNLVEAGVDGYILKNTGSDDLMLAIRTVASGKTFFTQEVTDAVMNSLKATESNAAPLTKREVEILQLVARAHTTAEIAEKLFISTYTVDTHRKNLLSKLNLKNTAALVKYAFDHGLMDDKFA